MKPLTKDDVKFTLDVEQEDLPVRGNAIESGDKEYDKQVEDEIIARLEQGDIWAWAAVKVSGSYKGLTAEEWLGGITCDDEENFLKDCADYYNNMCQTVLDNLNKQVAEIIADRTE